MKSLTITLSMLALAAVAGVASVATGAEAPEGLRKLGFKVYWSLLDDGQRERAKEIATDYLADTAPDRLEALAHLVRAKADVARILTKEQRIQAGRMKAVWKRLSKEDRKEYLQRLLDETDRAALAGRVERTVGAAPEEKVGVAIEILDQLFEVAVGRLETRLALSADQVAGIRKVYDGLKTDLEPLAVRIETAKQAAIRNGLAILDEDQKARIEEVRTAILDKVLEFIHG